MAYFISYGKTKSKRKFVQKSYKTKADAQKDLPKYKGKRPRIVKI